MSIDINNRIVDLKLSTDDRTEFISEITVTDSREVVGEIDVGFSDIRKSEKASIPKPPSQVALSYQDPIWVDDYDEPVQIFAFKGISKPDVEKYLVGLNLKKYRIQEWCKVDSLIKAKFVVSDSALDIHPRSDTKQVQNVLIRNPAIWNWHLTARSVGEQYILFNLNNLKGDTLALDAIIAAKQESTVERWFYKTIPLIIGFIGVLTGLFALYFQLKERYS